MMDWLMENKAWIFLAAGILLVTLVVGVFAAVMTQRRPAPVPPPPEPAPAPPPPPPERRITPSGLKRPEHTLALPSQPRSDLAVLALQNPRPKLQEVLTKVRRAPATQREDLADSFLGYPVTCHGQIKSSVKLKSGKLLIDLVDHDGGEDVFFEVHPAAYPALDLTQSGTPIMASGRFRVSASVVWLDDPEVAPVPEN